MKHFIPILCFIVLIGCKQVPSDSPIFKVNPFMGATAKEGPDPDGAYGKCYPGAVAPYGMVQLSPNTNGPGDCASGYGNEYEYIEGFGFTQLNGIGWWGEMGNFLVTPTTDSLKTFSGRYPKLGRGYRSKYSKTEEKASPGYYTTRLTDYNIKVELCAAPRSGIMRFTYPENKQSRIQIDLSRRIGGTSTAQYINVVDEKTIEGWIQCTPEGGGFGNGWGNSNYTVFFYAQFSKPLKNFGVWSADIPETWIRKNYEVFSERYDSVVSKANVLKGCKEKEGKHLGFYSEFETKANEQVIFKSGISFTSIEGAKQNLKKEIPGWDLDKVQNRTELLWDKALQKVSVTGGSDEQQKIFYTTLYHTMFEPRKIADADGTYIGADGNIHKQSNFNKRSMFSGWDVFRAQFPLQTIIQPELVSDMINSLIEMGDQSGKKYLAAWELLNNYSDPMMGNAGVNMMVDAYMKGIRNFDVEKAYQFAVNGCERTGNSDKGYSENLSKTFENSYSEWCLSQLAKSLGKTTDAEKYERRSASYKNLYDPSVAWFRVKDEKGNWTAWPEKGMMEAYYGCSEANPLQQCFFVPHDVDGFAALIGGKDRAIALLDTLIENASPDFYWNWYYNHSNETGQHCMFLYNRMGAPWLTQKWVREVCNRAYRNQIEGFCGDEDCGQLSAWYVMASTGLYMICPGDNRYEICSPLFDKVSYQIGDFYGKGKAFSIIAHNNSATNCYIQSAKLNGKALNKCWITHSDIVSGGTLELVMGSEPNKNWGVEK